VDYYDLDRAEREQQRLERQRGPDDARPDAAYELDAQTECQMGIGQRRRRPEKMAGEA
jgi:hypothetical protein